MKIQENFLQILVSIVCKISSLISSDKSGMEEC